MLNTVLRELYYKEALPPEQYCIVGRHINPVKSGIIKHKEDKL